MVQRCLLITAALCVTLLPNLHAQAGWASLPLQRTLMGNLLRNATGCTGTPEIDRAHPGSCPSAQSGPQVQANTRPAAPLRTAPAATAAARPANAQASIPFQGSAAIAGQVSQQAVDQMRQRSGDTTAQQLQGLLQRTDYRQEWVKMTASDGLHANDLIDIITAEWVLDWVIANHGDNDRAQTLGTRAQIAQAVGTVPALLKLSDAQRASFGYGLMLHQVITGAAYVQARRAGDQAAMTTLGNNARRDFQQAFGMDLASYNLTDAGLHPRQ